MNKAFKIARYIVFNSAIAYAMYLGVGHGNEGAKNIVWFYTVFVFIFGLFSTSKSIQDGVTKPTKRTVPSFIDDITNIIAVGYVVYYGEIAMASMLLVGLTSLSSFMTFIHKKAIELETKDNK